MSWAVVSRGMSSPYSITQEGRNVGGELVDEVAGVLGL